MPLSARYNRPHGHSTWENPMPLVPFAFLLLVFSTHIDAGDDAWQQAEFKKLTGRWTTTREEKSGGKTRMRRIELDLTSSRLAVLVKDEGGKSSFKDELKVKSVEPLKAVGLGGVGLLRLHGFSEKQTVQIYYDF